MSNALVDLYRCPEGLAELSVPEELHPQPGYFRFGPQSVCYGRSTSITPSRVHGTDPPDLSRNLSFGEGHLRLPFDLSEIVNNLRFERYPIHAQSALSSILTNENARQMYYKLRPMLPDSVRRSVQRLFFRDWDEQTFPHWPVDTSVERLLERTLLFAMKARKRDRIPFIWFWPNGAPGAAIVTHDVETSAGLAFVPKLLDVDDEFGVKASFQLVPEKRYSVPRGLPDEIRKRQCEVNVHGFNHEGNLFRNREVFLEQARQINRYIKSFGSDGFRSTCMYRNVEWYHGLDVSYDMSVPNVAHLEPQRGGCCSVFPYFIGRILELPLTTIQDYSLFHILGEYSIELWTKQIRLIMARHGLISVIVHPDYILTERAMSVYRKLLKYLYDLRSESGVWLALPGDVNRWWRERSQMRLVARQGQWRIEGQGHERARVAFARLKGDQVVYTLEESPEVNAEPARLDPVLVPSLRQPSKS